MPKEQSIVIEHRKVLTYMLSLAAEIEHAAMVQYLYTAFSLRTEAGPGLTSDQLDAVERWRQVVLDIAVEEMLHWALVNNLLIAVGSAPYVSRPNMPIRGGGYPPDVQFELMPFGERALRHFVFFERPDGVDIEDADGFEPAGPRPTPMSAAELQPRGQDFTTQGHLYRSIETGLERLSEKLGDEGLFIGAPWTQATAESFRWPDLQPVTDLAAARRVLERIVEQGEGARGDWESAHYGRFLTVLEEFLAMKASDPAFEPAHPVTGACVRGVEGVEPHMLISDPATACVSDLFNVVYDLLLQMIARYFAFGHETDEQRAVLVNATVQLMFGVIKPLGLLLAALPVGTDHPGATTGANFQLAYRSNFLLPHRRAAWIRFAERLEEAAELADSVAGDERTRRVLANVSSALRSTMQRLLAEVEPV